MSKTIEDLLVCPECGSEECYVTEHDEVEFLDEPHCVFYCYCKDCKRTFRMYFKFTYEITESRVSAW